MQGTKSFCQFKILRRETKNEGIMDIVFYGKASCINFRVVRRVASSLIRFVIWLLNIGVRVVLL